jgi:hypothetical protein
MKTKLILSLLFSAAAANGAGLYLPNDLESSVPVAWSIGVDAIWDDNTSPGGANDGDQTSSLNPYVSVSFVSVTPQTTLDVYARLGQIYYIDKPEARGADSKFGQARVGVNLTHRFNERLRFSSRNFLSYELEPDYSYGFAADRRSSEYLFWSTDNSIGYRWTERVGTYSGISLNGLDYSELPDSNRFTWTFYNQFRYQLSPQTVLTSTHRYSETSSGGVASDSTNQYFLVGMEHRFSPNTVFSVNTGAQMREMDGIGGNDSTNPYLELAIRSQVNEQFGVRAFARYASEDYDTIVGTPSTEYSDKLTLRVGVSANYQISPYLSLLAGLNVISSSYESGREVVTAAPAGDSSETLVNASIGASLKFTDQMYGTLTYNFTNSDSDILGRNYDRNRISVGLSAQF